jgi:hypothetical protein
VKVDGKKVKFTFEEKNQVLRINHSAHLNIEQNTSQIELKW